MLLCSVDVVLARLILGVSINKYESSVAGYAVAKMLPAAWPPIHSAKSLWVTGCTLCSRKQREDDDGERSGKKHFSVCADKGALATTGTKEEEEEEESEKVLRIRQGEKN